MELTAAIKALEYCDAQEERQPSLKQIRIYTDSTYVKDGITVWISNQAEDKQDKLNAWLAKRIANGAPDANIINKKTQRALIKRIAKRIKKKRNPTPDTPPGDG